MALSLDGHNHNTWSSGTMTVTLTTTGSADLIVACISQQVTGLSAGQDNISSVASTHTGTWARRSTIISIQESSQVISVWWAVASATLSSETITITFTSTASISNADVFAFGVSGANNSSPWDSGGSSNCPVEAGMSSTADMLITTNNANTMVIAYYKFPSVQSPTAGSGWTAIDTPFYSMVEYQIVSVAQTNLDATITTGSGSEIAGLGDAIVATTVVAVPDALSTPIFRLQYPPWR